MVIETGISAARKLGNPNRNDFSFGSQPFKHTLGESFISILKKALMILSKQKKIYNFM